MKRIIVLSTIALCSLCFSGCADTSLEKIGSLMECVNDIQIMKGETALQQQSLDAITNQLKAVE